MQMTGLPPAAVTVWRFMWQHVTDHGYPPTVRQTMTGLGYASTSTIQAHLRALETAGAIERPGGPGTYALVIHEPPADGEGAGGLGSTP